jgi:hypothetical protein
MEIREAIWPGIPSFLLFTVICRVRITHEYLLEPHPSKRLESTSIFRRRMIALCLLDSRAPEGEETWQQSSKPPKETNISGSLQWRGDIPISPPFNSD